jgi:hypothetical protein
MIIFQVEAKVKPGHEATFEDQLEKTTALIAQNEPNYALYSYLNSDQSQATFFNIATDAEALANHFMEAGNDPEGQKRLMSCLEITSVQLYGTLSVELEEKLKPMGAQFFKPHSGTFDRMITVRDSVPA